MKNKNYDLPRKCNLFYSGAYDIIVGYAIMANELIEDNSSATTGSGKKVSSIKDVSDITGEDMEWATRYLQDSTITDKYGSCLGPVPVSLNENLDRIAPFVIYTYLSNNPDCKGLTGAKLEECKNTSVNLGT